MANDSLIIGLTSKINVDQLETVILLVNSHYQIVDMNRAAQKMFAVGDSRRRNCSLTDILPYPDNLKAIIDAAIRNSSVIVKREFEIRIDLNYSKVIDCIVSPTNVPKLDVKCCFVEINDKEFFQRIKEANELTQQSDVWETIARELGHEIKNPLTGIRGTAQLLKDELPKGEYDEFIATIVEEVDRLSALSNRMLEGSHSVPNVQVVNIHEILDHVSSLVIAENTEKSGKARSSIIGPEGIEIKKLYRPPIIVNGDKNQLTQVFLNLLRNAVQAVGGAGEIIIDTKIGSKTAIGEKVFGKVAEIRFIDDGEGVDPKMKNSIFLPLVSRNKGGNGLGLSIAQKLARANRGIITLERNVRRTEFLVRIPMGEEFGSN